MDYLEMLIESNNKRIKQLKESQEKLNYILKQVEEITGGENEEQQRHTVKN